VRRSRGHYPRRPPSRQNESRAAAGGRCIARAGRQRRRVTGVMVSGCDRWDGGGSARSTGVTAAWRRLGTAGVVSVEPRPCNPCNPQEAAEVVNRLVRMAGGQCPYKGGIDHHHLKCAPDGGQFAGWELTSAAGLSEDESHGQAPHP
jgi:hypothetical protein